MYVFPSACILQIIIDTHFGSIKKDQVGHFHKGFGNAIPTRNEGISS